MKAILTAAVALSLLTNASAMAQPGGNQGPPDRGGPNRGAPNQGGPDRGAPDRGGPDRGPPSHRWAKGDRLPRQYMQDQYYVNDWRQQGLREPPRGYRWVRDEDNNLYLAAIVGGLIADSLYRDDRDQRWNQGHARVYTYNDDSYYQQCRNAPDPAGVLAGALIGGLLGNHAGNRRDRGASTAAGVIFGGALGAALTQNMDCGDRSYAYKTYYNGLNSGQPGSYQWRNPQTGDRGNFNVGRYYDDRDNFRCADFTQTIFIHGRPQDAHGTACRQPDGSWAIVN